MDNKFVPSPFIKWAGGKTKLLDKIEENLPDAEVNKYIEPFIGGGSVAIHIIDKHKINNIILSDKNNDLIDLYKCIATDSTKMLDCLEMLSKRYFDCINIEEKEVLYYEYRTSFNSMKKDKCCDKYMKSSLFIVLNKTGFNGLYRVNKKDLFNVSFGKREKPMIYEEKNIIYISKILKGIEIKVQDFEKSLEDVRKGCLVYLDPPYKPLSSTSNFTSYTSEGFIDSDFGRLKNFCDEIDKREAYFLLSISDNKQEDKDIGFFEEIFKEYNIIKITANRSIGCTSKSRKKIGELLIKNY